MSKTIFSTKTVLLITFILAINNLCSAYTTLDASKMASKENVEQSLKRYGSLSIYSEIPGIEIYIDGELKGRDMVKVDKIQIGSHLIKAAGGDRVVYSEIINVEEGALSTVVIKEKDEVIPPQETKPAVEVSERQSAAPLKLNSIGIGIHSITDTQYGYSGSGNGLLIFYQRLNPMGNNNYSYYSFNYTNFNIYDVPIRLFSTGLGIISRSNSIITGLGLLLGTSGYSYSTSTISMSGSGTGLGFELFTGYLGEQILINIKYAYLSINENVTAVGYGSSATLSIPTIYSSVGINLSIPF